MLHIFSICCLVLLNIALCYTDTVTVTVTDSPTDEMQKFIDECYYMIDTMNTCEDGWVELENSIIDSIDSFATKIVYTEGLIVDEADQILDMADRIVETEYIVSDLIKSCSCEAVSSSEIAVRVTNHSNATQTDSNTFSSTTGTTEPISTSTSSSTSNDTLLSKSLTECDPMDDMVKVLDQCIDSFQAFSDDFLDILNSLNQGILAMGDQIVDTECLIMNMSVQIGVVADEIVATEELAADMASSCCATPASTSAGSESDTATNAGKKRRETQNDDVIPDCTSDSNTKSDIHIPLDLDGVRLLINGAASRYVASLSSIPLMKRYLQDSSPGLSYLHTQYNRAMSLTTKSGSTSGSVGDLMPCESMLDPFCCAMEVCSDIMVAMIQDMTDGMGQLTDLCTECIDEVASLSVMIVDLERQIVEMGVMMGEMTECMVYFMYQGEQFMVQFCDADLYEHPYQHGVRVGDGDGGTCSGESQGSGTVAMAAQKIRGYTSAHTMLQEAKKARRLASQVQVQFKASTRFVHFDRIHRFLREFVEQIKTKTEQSDSKLTSNPFGEFVEMVDVCLEMSKLMADMVIDQVGVMNHMIEEVFHLSDDVVATMGLIADMSSDIVTMMDKMRDTEDLMLELISCFE